MSPLHVALYHFVNSFQKDLAIDIPQINGVVSDQCHGNKNNWVAASFLSCTGFYLYTGYYELLYIETRIILPRL